MSSIIKRPAEITGKETIAALIYGQSGMGKTTLACSAPSPLMLDFDGGVARIKDEHQVPTVQVSKWEDAEAALRELEVDGSEFKTIIVDTLSKMIDDIIISICGTANPTFKQWGLVNAKFKNFLRGVQSLGKHIVFVAQREVEKNGDDTRYVPQVRASNYKDIICDLDVCGYMEMVVDKGRDVRKITFNPTSRNEGKNTAGFEPAYYIFDIPEGAPNNFLSARFSEYIERQRESAKRRAEKARQVAEEMDAFGIELESCTDARSLNSLVEAVKEMPANGDIKLRKARAIKERAEKIGCTLNKETKLYE